jgi:hypothetical protein
MNEKHQAESADLIKNPPGSFEVDLVQKTDSRISFL